jgi:hypothetical protein
MRRHEPITFWERLDELIAMSRGTSVESIALQIPINRREDRVRRGIPAVRTVRDRAGDIGLSRVQICELIALWI